MHDVHCTFWHHKWIYRIYNVQKWQRWNSTLRYHLRFRDCCFVELECLVQTSWSEHRRRFLYFSGCQSVDSAQSGGMDRWRSNQRFEHRWNLGNWTWWRKCWLNVSRLFYKPSHQFWQLVVKWFCLQICKLEFICFLLTGNYYWCIERHKEIASSEKPWSFSRWKWPYNAQLPSWTSRSVHEKNINQYKLNCFCVSWCVQTLCVNVNWSLLLL